MTRTCHLCFRHPTFRVTAPLDVGPQTKLACHFHLQRTITEFLGVTATVEVTYG